MYVCMYLRRCHGIYTRQDLRSAVDLGQARKLLFKSVATAVDSTIINCTTPLLRSDRKRRRIRKRQRANCNKVPTAERWLNQRQNMFGEDENIGQLVLEPPFCGKTHFKTPMNFIRAHVDLEYETNTSIRKIFLTRTQ